MFVVHVQRMTVLVVVVVLEVLRGHHFLESTSTKSLVNLEENRTLNANV